jgi:pimeloyl-ACP methyl ester carboxylesterase
VAKGNSNHGSTTYSSGIATKIFHDAEAHGITVVKVSCMFIKCFPLLAMAMMFSCCNIQNTFLYFPNSSMPSPEALKSANVKQWPSYAADYRGLISINETGHINGTVIVFHGNAGTAADRVFYVKALSSMGYRVILAEYPGYGGRTGELGEESFVLDANETTKLAYEQFGEPIFLLGESLGCGVAAGVARKTAVKIEGIVLITPWDSLASIAHSKFPFLPVRLLLTDKYDNIVNLELFKGRIVIVGAERDEVIPIEHANTLYKSLSNFTKRMWMIRGARHNDWPMFTDMSWWKEIMGFVSGKDNQQTYNRLGTSIGDGRET